jgi:hypothetical protein
MKDILSGSLFIVIGAIFGIGSGNYSIGSTDNIGPGYYPLMVSIAVIAIGVAIIIKKILWIYRQKYSKVSQ